MYEWGIWLYASRDPEIWYNSFRDFIDIGRNTEVSIEMSDNCTISEHKFY